MNIKPILKWVGGKQELIPELSKYYNILSFNKYIEPFMGDGVILLDIINKKPNTTCLLNNKNKDLINLYRHIKMDPEELYENCVDLELTFKKYGYYYIRDKFNGINTEKYKGITRSAALILLNKTSYNGLYKLNKKGLYSTPEGKVYNPTIVIEENLHNFSKILPNVSNLLSINYNKIPNIEPNDFVYFDPPYDTLTKTTATDYCGAFEKKDHIILRDYFKELDEKGVFVILSNSSTEYIKTLYSDFTVIEVDNINPNGVKKNKTQELIIIGNHLKNY
jgi:DNA adenine methylase